MVMGQWGTSNLISSNLKWQRKAYMFTLTGVEGRVERGLGGSSGAAGEGEEEGREDKEGTMSWCKFCTGHFFDPFSLKAKLAT